MNQYFINFRLLTHKEMTSEEIEKLLQEKLDKNNEEGYSERDVIDVEVECDDWED